MLCKEPSLPDEGRGKKWENSIRLNRPPPPSPIWSGNMKFFRQVAILGVILPFYEGNKPENQDEDALGKIEQQDEWSRILKLYFCSLHMDFYMVIPWIQPPSRSSCLS